MLAKFFSTLYWVVLVGVSSIFFFFPIAVTIWLLTILFDRRLAVLHMWTSIWASTYSWLNPLWTVKVLGREKVDPKKAYVIVSNHQSMVDILVLFRLFIHFKWVSKAENFKIVFVGWNMTLNKYIKLHRGKVKSNAALIKDCTRALENGSSVFIFPEGTRSNDGKLGPFRRGAFEIAIRTGKPILPVLVDGSAHALPKKGVTMRNRADIKLQVMDEIPPESFQGLNAEELTKRTHEYFEKELATFSGGAEPARAAVSG